MADIATTTGSEPQAAARAAADRHVSYAAGAVAACILGAALLWLGVPRLVAAVITLDARDVLWRVGAQETVAVPQLLDAADDLAAARRWVESGDFDIDRGVLLARAASASASDAREGLFDAAERATADGLALSPGQPAAWLRLAWLRERRGDTAGALAALRMSMLSGSFEPTLLRSRIEMGLRLRPAMNAEMNALLQRQIRQTWVVQPSYVFDLGNRNDTRALVYQALNELSDAEIARFHRLHGGQPWPGGSGRE